MREAFIAKIKSKTVTKRLSLRFVCSQPKEYKNGELSSCEPWYGEVVVTCITRNSRLQKLGFRVCYSYKSKEKDLIRHFLNIVLRAINMTGKRI